MTCPLPVIGVLRTSRATPETTPVQAALNRAEHGTLELRDEYVDGLAGLAGFDYVWLVTWLGTPADGPPVLTGVPFLLRPRQQSMGVFATRGPRRVNPIGLSLVRLLAVTGTTVRFAGVDMVDGTPVLDLKPYVTHFDRPPGEPRSGWFDTATLTEGVTPDDLR